MHCFNIAKSNFFFVVKLKVFSIKCIWKKCVNYFNWHVCRLGEIAQEEEGGELLLCFKKKSNG